MPEPVFPAPKLEPVWIAAAGVALALPVSIAYNLPPSATFFNQATAFIAWGCFTWVLALEIPHGSRPGTFRGDVERKGERTSPCRGER